MEQMCIEGFFSTIIYKSDLYTVAKFKTNDKNEKYLTVTGYVGNIYEDRAYRLHGTYVEHYRYGMQFQIQSYEIVMPNDESSLIKYFSSSLFSGIGKKAATRIVSQLGKDAIDLLKDNPDIIKQIVGLSDAQRESLRDGIKNSVDESILFLTQYGVSNKNILKIEAVYGDEAIQKIKNNPYQMIMDIDGIGFKTADKIAMQLGFDAMDHNRIKAAIVAIVLALSMKSGNTFESLDTVFSELRKQLAFDDETLFLKYVDELHMDRQVFVEGKDIYHISQYDAEQGIVSFLKSFPFYERDPEVKDEVFIKDKIQAIASYFQIEYGERQVAAIQTFYDAPFSILTGGPGTGKTTIVRAIIRLYKELYPFSPIALCAPTGRAAKRLGELGGIDATTIHSLLKWDLETNVFSANEENPIQAELLIIDEFSMVDSWLFYNLLRASHQVKKILIIGDDDQLPSVGPGFVLKDLISCQHFPTTKLDKIYRQSEGSDVIRVAHDIRQGILTDFSLMQDVRMYESLNYQVKDHVLRIVASAFEKGYSDLDIQVLAPMYNGVAGIDALNKSLQELCNPVSSEKTEIHFGYRIFREGDKILQLKNQPDDGVYNGDIGKITTIIRADDSFHRQNEIYVDFDGTEVLYTNENFINITHAYCISIHKSQGSEYPIVVMPILSDYAYMLQRRLIYTGITRAKKSLILLGDAGALKKGIARVHLHDRKTKLLQRLQNSSSIIDF